MDVFFSNLTFFSSSFFRFFFEKWFLFIFLFFLLRRSAPPQDVHAKCPACDVLNRFPGPNIPKIACYKCDTPIDSPLFVQQQPAKVPVAQRAPPASHQPQQPQYSNTPTSASVPSVSSSSSGTGGTSSNMTSSASSASVSSSSSSSSSGSSGKLAISGPIKVRHTGANDLLSSTDPHAAPALKKGVAPSPRKAHGMKGLKKVTSTRFTKIGKGIRPSFSKKKKDSSSAAIETPEGRRPTVSGPMNVVKTSDHDDDVDDPPASTMPPPDAQGPPPRRPPPRTAEPSVPSGPKPVVRPKAAAPQPAAAQPPKALELDVVCDSCQFRNTLPPRVLRIACEGCGLPVDAPPPPAASHAARPPPPRRGPSAADIARKQAEEAERLVAEQAERQAREQAEAAQAAAAAKVEADRAAAAQAAQAAQAEADRAAAAAAAATAQTAVTQAEEGDDDDEEEDDDYSKFMADCPSCFEPNIFPENVPRIACWNCNNAMDAPPGMMDSSPAAAAAATEPSPSPAADPAIAAVVELAAVSAAPAPEPEPAAAADDGYYDDGTDDGDGELEGDCLACGELNLFPAGAPRIACWSCGQVVELPTNDAPAAEPVAQQQQQQQQQQQYEEDNYDDDELQGDCPHCNEPNIFPEGAPRIACWNCEAAIDRPAE
jgi:ribosomal protein S27E